jgi:hypothetical protein
MATHPPILCPEQADALSPPAVITEQGVFVPTPVARIPQIPERYADAFTEDALRAWIYQATWSEVEPYKSLRDCVIRIGRVVMIDLRGFDAWLQAHRGFVDPATRGKLGGRPPKKVARRK